MCYQPVIYFLLPFLVFLELAQAADDSTLEKRAIRASKRLSERVEKAAHSIDMAIAGKKYTKQKNDSQVTLSQLVSHTEGGVLKNSTDLGVNLRLPNVEKRWQLRFSSATCHPSAPTALFPWTRFSRQPSPRQRCIYYRPDFFLELQPARAEHSERQLP